MSTAPSIVAATALALLLQALPAAAQTPVVTTVAPQNIVTLSASATTEVVRDELTIVFSTAREGADAAQVQAQLRQALDAALAEARKAARPGQIEVRTGNFTLNPRYAPKGGLQSWVGQAELVVEGRDTAGVSQLAGRIQTLSIARTQFGLSREARDKVEAEVTAQAIATFKRRAEQAAKHFGFGGWSLREVQIGNVDAMPPQPALMRSQALSSAGAAEALPVEAGRAQLSVTVSGSVQLSAR